MRKLISTILGVSFKFHYVSINSTIYASIITSNITLNSIMFLLILASNQQSKDASFTFKFHYVSINSYEGDHFEYAIVDFKFHYVSINSVK